MSSQLIRPRRFEKLFKASYVEPLKITWAMTKWDQGTIKQQGHVQKLRFTNFILKFRPTVDQTGTTAYDANI